MCRCRAVLIATWMVLSPGSSVFSAATRAPSAGEVPTSAAPVAASPGSPTGAAVASACPTFSWGSLAGAVGYEIVVYRVEEGGALASAPVLTQRIPGPALAWTPPPDRCPAGSGRYAWSARALTENGPSGWGEPLFFEVGERPSMEELERALAVIRRYLGSESPELAGTVSEIEIARAQEVEGDSAFDQEPVAGDAFEVGPAASFQVSGEVRALGPDGEARTWGEGRRNGSIHGLLFGPCSAGDVSFGLSRTAVDWGSAASACPVGSWVCRHGADILTTCNTDRPDSQFDAFDCAGTAQDFATNAHQGWVDATGLGNGTSGAVLTEDEVSTSRETCWSLPVWCCWVD